MGLKHDVADRIVLTSQLINKDLLQGQGQRLHQDGGVYRHAGLDLGRIAPDDQGVHPTHLGGVQHVQVLRQLGQPGLLKGQLQLDHVVLQIGEGALQQHLSVGQDAHVVTHVLQLPQVVGGDEHRGPPLGHVPHKQGPHLPPHHRIQAVHRLVQHQHLGLAAQGQPEGRLLLHPLGQPADGLLLVYLGEGLLQRLVALVVKARVHPPVKFHHVPGGGRLEVVQLVGDDGNFGLYCRILIHRLAVHPHGARVIPYAVAYRHCCRLNYGVRGKRYFTIGFPNVAGGYEIRSKLFKGCIPPKDVSLIKPEDTASDVCSVFEGFMDFLSADTLGIGGNGDSLVLNSVANVGKAVKHLDGYGRIDCFLDRDEAGRRTLEALKGHYGGRVCDRSALYDGCKDLNEYLQLTAKKEMNNNLKIKGQ